MSIQPDSTTNAVSDAALELRRLRDGLDTLDWLLHEDRQSDNPQTARRLTEGEGVKRDAVALIRALLGDEWFAEREIPND